MRQTQGSMICPQCGRLIGIDEEKCPFCGAWRPSMFGYAPVLQRLFGNRFDPVPLIITACVLLYIVSIVLDPSGLFQMRGLLSFLSPSGQALYNLGMTGSFLLTNGMVIPWMARPWTLLTAIYLHGGLLHIFFNMMSIRNLGPGVTDIYGPARTFVIFSVAGAAGFLVSDVVTGAHSIGASGGIFGLLGALIVYARRRGSSVMSTQLWQWAILMFAMGFFITGVNNWAHAGGFAGGWLAGRTMHFSDERRESPAVQVLALALLVATVAGFVLALMGVNLPLVSG